MKNKIKWIIIAVALVVSDCGSRRFVSCDEQGLRREQSDAKFADSKSGFRR